MKLALKPIRLNTKVIQLLPIATSFILVAFITAKFQFKHEATALFLGVIAGALGDIDHRITGRLKNLIFILVGFSVCAILVQLSLPHPALIILLMTAIAFITTMMGAIDSRYRTVSFATLLVALYVLLTYHPELPWYINPAMILLGSLIYQLCNIGFHLIFPNQPVQESLAQSFLELSTYVQIKARFFSPDERQELQNTQHELAKQTSFVTQAFNHTRDILFNRLAGQKLPELRRRQLNDFFIAQDIHERTSASHVDYQELTLSLAHSDVIFRVERLLNLQARACREYAYHLLTGKAFTLLPILNRAYQGLLASLTAYQSQHPQHHSDLQRLVTNLGELNEQINKLGTLPSHLADPSLASSQAGHIREIFKRLKNNFTIQSTVFRHAIRISTITLVTTSLVEILNLNWGYWIVLTAVLVCQPNQVATKTRLIQRIKGTITGVLMGILIAKLQLESTSLLLIMMLSSIAFFSFRLKNYTLSSFFITVQVFAGFNFIGIYTISDSLWRIYDTILGSSISFMFGMLVLPDWKFMSLKKVAEQVIHSNAHYLRVILHQLQHGYKDDIQYRAARRRVHENAAALAGLAHDLAQHKHHVHLAKNTNQLVLINYKLIGHLSVLGAYRGHLTAQDQDILPSIIDCGNHFANLIQEIPQLSESLLSEQIQWLQNTLNTINQVNQSIMSHPLLRNIELLKEYAQLIQTCSNQKPPKNGGSTL